MNGLCRDVGSSESEVGLAEVEKLRSVNSSPVIALV